MTSYPSADALRVALPKLTGSPNSVKQATELRRVRVNGLVEEITDLVNYAVKTYGANREKLFALYVEDYVVELMKPTKYWIDKGRKR